MEYLKNNIDTLGDIEILYLTYEYYFWGVDVDGNEIITDKLYVSYSDSLIEHIITLDTEKILELKQLIGNQNYTDIYNELWGEFIEKANK